MIMTKGPFGSWDFNPINGNENEVLFCIEILFSIILTGLKSHEDPSGVFHILQKSDQIIGRRYHCELNLSRISIIRNKYNFYKQVDYIAQGLWHARFAA